MKLKHPRKSPDSKALSPEERDEERERE